MFGSSLRRSVLASICIESRSTIGKRVWRVISRGARRASEIRKIAARPGGSASRAEEVSQKSMAQSQNPHVHAKSFCRCRLSGRIFETSWHRRDGDFPSPLISRGNSLSIIVHRRVIASHRYLPELPGEKCITRTSVC